MKPTYNKKHGGYSKPGRTFSKGPSSWKHGGDDKRKEMFSATCAECGDHCQVPFKPNGRKPVHCSNCYRRDDEGGERSFGGERKYVSTPRFQESGFRGGNQGASNDAVVAQLKALNAKMDQLLAALEEAGGGDEDFE